MLSSYRRILSQPGTLLFSASGFVARLPISMVSLGIVLLVSAATGSYALAGSVSAAYMIANGGLAVVQGRLLDRLGQARVLVRGRRRLRHVPHPAHVVGPGGLAAASRPTSSAAVAGATLPAVGSCVRARWSHVLSSADQLQTAFALEAVWDETVFMLGPILVTVLATTWHPLAGLIAALVAAVVGTLAFAAQRSTEPPAHPAEHVDRSAAADAVGDGRPARAGLRRARDRCSVPRRSARSRSPRSTATGRTPGSCSRCGRPAA